MGAQPSRCCSTGRSRPDLPPPEESQPLSAHAAPAVKEKMGVFLQQGEHDLLAEEKAAFTKPHRCTDVFCSVVFLLALVGVHCVLRYAWERGDIRKLTYGMDWQGKLCGLDPEVKSKRYLYWCTRGGTAMTTQDLADAGMEAYANGAFGKVYLEGVYAVLARSNRLDLEHPICVDSCPTSTSTKHSCYQKEELAVDSQLLTGSFTKHVTYKLSFVQDYPSSAVAGRYCLPTESDYMRQIEGKLNWGVEASLFRLSHLRSAWQPILLSAAIAVVLGYLYLFLAKRLAIVIVGITAVLAVVLPMAAGIYMLCNVAYHHQAWDNDGWSTHHFHIHAPKMLSPEDKAESVSTSPTDWLREDWRHRFESTSLTDLVRRAATTGDRRLDVALGFVLTALGALVALAALALRRKVSLVLGALEAACDCIFDMPGMLLFPLMACIPRALYCFGAIYSLGLLLTVGEVERYEVRSRYQEYIPQGLARQFSLGEDQQIYFMYLAFMSLWGLELMVAIDQFVFQYATQRWYFKEYVEGTKSVPHFVFVRGYFVAVLYHLGSLALGSFIIALFRVLYFVLSFLHHRVKESVGDNGHAQAVVRVTASCCCCCLQLFEKLIRFLNKNAYLVVGLESLPFCEAAEEALGVLASESAALAGLSGATTVFQACGLMSITGVGSLVTWTLCVSVHRWKDVNSVYYVNNPEAVAVVAGVISCAIAFLFTFVFDTVSDTMLFCYALDKRAVGDQAAHSFMNRDMSPMKGRHAPLGFQKLVNEHGGGPKALMRV